MSVWFQVKYRSLFNIPIQPLISAISVSTEQFGENFSLILCQIVVYFGFVRVKKYLNLIIVNFYKSCYIMLQ